ncbi:hypothetical protein BH11MYX4_BH11MYX4_31700 [soil metagenome]
MRRWDRSAFPLLCLCAVVGGVVVHLGDADAQRLDPRRPSVFVVGSPGGASPTTRGDGRRTGVSKELLPAGVLHVAWRKTIGLTIDQPALVGPDGMLAIVTARGDVVFLDESGEERGRASSGTTSVGPATMTSDGTVVFMSSAGDAVGVRRASPRPRFVTRVGGERNLRAAPLSLDDGGVVVATATDLVVLDAEGNVRARVSLPETPAAPLLASGDRVIAVTTTGAVYGWTPGREPFRLGSFGAPIDGGAALGDANTLIAVIEGNHLVELDLTRAARSTRSVAAQGLYLGPPSVRAVAAGGTLATLLAQTASRAFVVTLDPGGQETARAPIATLTPITLPDGGPAALVARPHTGPIVDPRGAIAFAAPDGHVGMVAPDGAVDTLGELICTQNARSAGIAGLTPFGRGAFAITCEGGVIARITGPEAPGLRRAPAAAPLRPKPGPAAPAPASSAEDDEP